ncbi:hypothetical protein Dacet_0795 [Denitrovibrio acetiphilus DSM 12809]|uniref:Uncharacterized protein n=1 Tax=Denitrovibrio acetiphilus (strain DSM 12809 / NBRC 114555 / N2460) TaxID=522772 RepID=D4H5F5_DENA2|nr:hypothetical protein Dacet_0795 [Denitrovibrio acetiphilus DSM 12809]
MKNKKLLIKPLFYILTLILVSGVIACGGSNTGDGASPVDASKGNAPQLIKPSDHGGGFGWENEKCYLCHTVAELEDAHDFSPNLIDSFGKLDSADTGACLYCHGTNGLSGITAESYQCTKCHADSNIVRSADMFKGHNTHDMNGDGEMTNADCVVCHSFSDMNGEIDVSVDFTKGSTAYTDVSSFCLNCHDGNGAFGIMPPALKFDADTTNLYSTYMGVGETESVQRQTADIHGVKNGNGQSFADFRGLYASNTTVSCLSCHKVHTSDNKYLITDSGESADLADAAALGASVSVKDDDFSELCALCHVTVGGSPTDNGLTGVVHSSTYSSKCTDCHYHGAGYGATEDLF